MGEFSEKSENEAKLKKTRPHNIICQDTTGFDNVTFTACIREFSTSIHQPGQAVIEENLGNGEFSLKVFANGIDSKSEGHVSVLVESNNPRYFYPLCLVGMKDATGETRFLRSFAFPFESANQSCLIEQYIKTETLFADPLDLLPDDCLALFVSIEIHFARRFDLSYRLLKAKVSTSFKSRLFEEGTRYFLSLDTKLFEKLIEESSYFQRMSETSMVERSTRFMQVPKEELWAFHQVCHIVMKCKCVVVPSIEELCYIYVLAEKYQLLSVKDECRQMFIALLRADDKYVKTKLSEDNLQPIYQLAEMYNDDLLVKVLESLSSRSYDIDIVSFLNTEWRVCLDKQLLNNPILNKRIQYFFTKRPEDDEDHDNIEYNFYQ